jgi:uncharacterized damage-inducible protein DinB
MMKRALTLLLLASATLSAQKPSQQPSATGSAKMLWKDVTGYITEAAMDLPAEKYAYRPTPKVRTFGELIAHIAGAQEMFCAIALGEKPPAEDAIELGATTKEALVAALRVSNEHCARAYAQSDKAAMVRIDLFGSPSTRLHALMMNATHDNEHYGNIITYLRMNDMVPPSSKPRPPRG